MDDLNPHRGQSLGDVAMLASAGRLDEAERLVRNILARAPQDADALNAAGVVSAQCGKPGEAVAYYERALVAAPSLVKARSNLGAALLALGRWADAERHLRQACAEDPAHAPAFANLGQLQLRQGRTADALSSFERAAALASGDATNWSNLAAAQLQAGQERAAADSLRQALEIAPRLVAAWINLANLLDRLDEPAEMLDAVNRALSVLPDAAELHAAAGIALRKLGRDEEALAAHENALSLRPDLARARFNRSLLLLALGQFRDGWRDFQSRPSAMQSGLNVELLPRNLDGQRILLRTNQGLGDEVFFLRFATELKRRGAWIVYRSSPKLANLICRCAILDAVTVDDSAVNADKHLLVDDLPYALAADERMLLPPLPLAPLPDRADIWRERLAAAGPAPYLGLTWRAGVNALGQLYKTLPISLLANAIGNTTATLISLQRLPQAGETAAFAAAVGRPVHDFSAVNDDLEDALALLSLLDDYVAVSNTNVHLRAGLGLPSRVLVPFPPEYRWMIEGDESPWFPGSRVYRQTKEREWTGALTQLSHDLARGFANRL